MKRNVLIIYIVILLLATVVSVQTAISKNEKAFEPDKAFLKASAYYEKGDWNKAIEENESILRQGIKSGNLLYNLGNCYLQKGVLGMAVLSYERARWLIPRDSDLLFNYAYARSLMKQQEVSDKGNMFSQFLIRTFAYLTLKENILLVCVLYYVIVLSIIGALFFQKARPILILLLILVTVSTLVQVFPITHKIGEFNHGAIVTANITDARFEPLPGADVHFPLYEGMKVYILRMEEDWCRVKRPDGKIGWVKKETVELIRKGDVSP